MEKILSTIELYKNNSLNNYEKTTLGGVAKALENNELDNVTAIKLNYLKEEDIKTALSETGVILVESSTLEERKVVEASLKEKVEPVFIFVGRIMNNTEFAETFNKSAENVDLGLYAVSIDDEGQAIDYVPLSETTANKEFNIMAVNSTEELYVKYYELTGQNLTNQRQL